MHPATKPGAPAQSQTYTMFRNSRSGVTPSSNSWTTALAKLAKGMCWVMKGPTPVKPHQLFNPSMLAQVFSDIVAEGMCPDEAR